MIYDLLIVGAGPAGLSAAVYAARFRLKTAILASEVGGIVVNAPLLENWPGIKSISGAEFMERMVEHVKGFGVEIMQTEVREIKTKGKNFMIKTDDAELESRTVLLATGTEHRKLGVSGEEEFHGKGVSFCAVCDAAFFRDKIVAVIGGSDSAAKEALLLSEYAKQVYIIYRRERIRAEPINAERVEKKGNIEVIGSTNVMEIKGDKFVESVTLDKAYDGSRNLPVDGVFVEIGYEPRSELAKGLGLKLDKEGQIIADRHSRTSVPGAYAAGDVTSDGFKQVITAAAQGVMAANSAYQYINGKYNAIETK